MEYSRFSEIILRLKKHHEKVNKAYELKIDLIDFGDDLNRVIDSLIKEVYGEEGTIGLRGSVTKVTSARKIGANTPALAWLMARWLKLRRSEKPVMVLQTKTVNPFVIRYNRLGNIWKRTVTQKI